MSGGDGGTKGVKEHLSLSGGRGRSSRCLGASLQRYAYGVETTKRRQHKTFFFINLDNQKKCYLLFNELVFTKE